jgi:hypothetical protein
VSARDAGSRPRPTARTDVRIGPGPGRDARLYRPDRPREPPLVVLVPGLGPDAALRSVAERYAEHGYAALLVERPAGTPVDPSWIRRRLDRALERGPRLDGVRGPATLRVADLAAGPALSLAATRRVGAVVVRAPVLDGRRLLARPPAALARLGVAALRDRLGPGDRTISLRATGDRPGPALLAAAAAPGAPVGAPVPARSALALARHRTRADDLVGVVAPVLVVGPADDPVAGDPVAAAERLPAGVGTTLRWPAGGEGGLAHEFAFLADVLPADGG